jgi:hypothetical protein
MPLPYKNRTEAAGPLIDLLQLYASGPHGLILALPRGGVPIAYEIARRLHLELDLMLVRKLGVPGHAELAMGAIAPGDTHVLNEEVIRGLAISDAMIDRVVAAERHELQRRERAYRGGAPGAQDPGPPRHPRRRWPGHRCHNAGGGRGGPASAAGGGRGGRAGGAADALNAVGLATLLFDLLTPQEEVLDARRRELRFNIGLLADRLTSAVGWLSTHLTTQRLRAGLFGGSTGAARAPTWQERPCRRSRPRSY